MNDQTSDLFGFRACQGDLFANEAPRTAGTVSADPDRVRVRLLKMLAEARAAQSAPPWNERTTRLYQTIFPQMTKWLPDPEAEQLRLEFQNELERLKLSYDAQRAPLARRQTR